MLALGVAAVIHRLLATETLFTAYALTFALASALMLISSFSFVSAGEPPPPSSGRLVSVSGHGVRYCFFGVEDELAG